MSNQSLHQLLAEGVVSVSRYEMAGSIVIDRVQQHDGKYKWVIRRNGNCLTKAGDWIHEPMSSGRTDEFLETTRWPDAESAVIAVVKLAS